MGPPPSNIQSTVHQTTFGTSRVFVSAIWRNKSIEIGAIIITGSLSAGLTNGQLSNIVFIVYVVTPREKKYHKSKNFPSYTRLLLHRHAHDYRTKSRNTQKKGRALCRKKADPSQICLNPAVQMKYVELFSLSEHIWFTNDTLATGNFMN